MNVYTLIIVGFLQFFVLLVPFVAMIAGQWMNVSTKMEAAEFDNYTERLRASLEAIPAVVGLVTLGSTADASLRDEWSDHGDGQTILREALLIADHNAYHLGVLAVMSRIAKIAE